MSPCWGSMSKIDVTVAASKLLRSVTSPSTAAVVTRDAITALNSGRPARSVARVWLTPPIP